MFVKSHINIHREIKVLILVLGYVNWLNCDIHSIIK